jgi:hypothetical protein
LALASLLVLLSTPALMVSDGLELLAALFEVTSAFGTVGLSLEVTPHLSTFGKILISVVMFLGRVGPITFIVALAARQGTPQYKYQKKNRDRLTQAFQPVSTLWALRPSFVSIFSKSSRGQNPAAQDSGSQCAAGRGRNGTS